MKTKSPTYLTALQLTLMAACLSFPAAHAQQSALIEGTPVPYKLHEATYEKGLKGDAVRVSGEGGYAQVDGDVPNPETFTVELFVKLNALPAGGVIAGRRSPEGNCWQLYTHPTGAIFFQAYAVGNAVALELRDVGRLQAGKWHHISFTIDAGGKAKFYVDGEAASEEQLSKSLNRGLIPLRVGGLGHTGKVLNGLVEDVRLYSGPISGDRLKEIQTALAAQ